jgi:hypothetical protein
VERDEDVVKGKERVNPRWRDFQSYVSGLNEVHRVLTVATGAITALDKKLTQVVGVIEKIEKKRQNDSRVGQLVHEIAALREEVAALTAAQARSNAVEPESEPESEPTPEPEPEETDPEKAKSGQEPEIEKPRLGSLLADNFRGILDFGDLDEVGHEDLETIFSLITADANGSVTATSNRFRSLLFDFVESTRDIDAADRSTAAFAKFVTTRAVDATPRS